MPKFPYIIFPTPTGGKIYKPLIQVKLSYSKTHKFTDFIWALIDSGSDTCVCHENIGMWLGINFRNKKVVSLKAANNQEFITHKELVTLHTCGIRFKCPFYFSDTLPPTSPIILGQIGFFDRFKVSFDLRNKEIALEYSSI